MWLLLLVLPIIVVGVYLWLRKQRVPLGSAPHLATVLVSEPHIAAHAYSIRHRSSLRNSAKCGCFYCLSVFAPDEITDWVDDGQTALCPKCGIDAVIGSDSGFPITREFLERMQNHWF
jgi:hypothetical protein